MLEETAFRSQLEATVARELTSRLELEWVYEPLEYRLPNGEGYVPDFWVPGINAFIEVKGYRTERWYKARLLAELLDRGHDQHPRVWIWQPWQPLPGWLWLARFGLGPGRTAGRWVRCGGCEGWLLVREDAEDEGCERCGAPWTERWAA